MICQCHMPTHKHVHAAGECGDPATIRLKIIPPPARYEVDPPIVRDVCGRCFGHTKKILPAEQLEVVASGPTYRALIEKEASENESRTSNPAN